MAEQTPPLRPWPDIDPHQTRPERPPAWQPAGSAAHLTAVESEATTLTLALRLPWDAPVPTRRTGFTVILPAGATATPIVDRVELGDRVVFDRGRTEDVPTTRAQSGFQPSAVRVESRGYLRQWPIHRLEIEPDFWASLRHAERAEGDDLSAILKIGWNDLPATATQDLPAADEANHGIARVAAHLVINPRDLARWATPSPPIPRAAEPLQPESLAPDAPGWMRVVVTETGLHRLSVDGLTTCGLIGNGFGLEDVRIFDGARPVPTHVVQQTTANGKSPLDGVYFYGWASQGPYSSRHVYWATVSKQAAAPEWSTPPAFLLEEERQPLATIRGKERRDRDLTLQMLQDNFLNIRQMDWVEAELTNDQPFQFRMTPYAPVAPPAPQEARLHAHLYLHGPPEAWRGTELILSHGGRPIAKHRINGAGDTEIDVAITTNSLLEAARPITLAVATPSSATLNADDELGIWLDWAELHYPAQPVLRDGRLRLDGDAVTTAGLYRLSPARVFADAIDQAMAFALNPTAQAAAPLDWGEPAADSLPAIVRENWISEYWDMAAAIVPPVAPVAWRPDDLAAGRDADYLIITTPELEAALKPLIDLNAARGLKSHLLHVDSLYDFFSDGALSPEAIRRYLAWLIEQAGAGAPDYVLLVGDSTSDYLNRTRSPVVNQVPTYSFDYGSETWASDYWYTCVAGDDDLGDYLIGRLSLNNPDDLGRAVAKLIEYAHGPRLGPWRATLAYVADNLEDFREAAEQARVDGTPAALDSRRIYLDRMPFEDNWYVPKSYIEWVMAVERNWMKVSAHATDQIKAAFNEGVALLDFYGHGAPNLWTDERIFFGGDSENRDTQYLAADGVYPFVTNFTCNTGAFDYPMTPWNICLSEDLLRTPHGGAIGLFVPSGPGTTVVHRELAAQLRRALFQDNFRGLGEWTLLARLRFALESYSASSVPRDILYMYNLLGDPALDLQLTQRWGELEARPNPITPDIERVTVALNEVQPPSGKPCLWLENPLGERIWESEPFTYGDGQIEREIELPAALREESPVDGNPHLVLYGWNAAEGRDFSASVDLVLARPHVEMLDPRAEWLEGGRARIAATLRNASQVAIGPVGVRAMRLASGPAAAVGETSLTISADDSREISFEFDEPGSTEPIAYQLTLSPPWPADDPSIAVEPTTRVVLPPATDWSGFLPALSSRQFQGDAWRAQVVIGRGGGGLAPRRLVLRHGDRPTSWALNFSPAPGWERAEQTLTVPGDIETATLELFAEDALSSAPLVVLPLARIPIEQPRLRIVPGSIRHRPENPTDGETIFIAFEVENAGNALSRPAQPALLDAPPEERGGVLPSQTGLPPASIPPLGAGRRMPVELRWDPIKNEGMQRIWVDLRAARGNEPKSQEQVAPYSLYVRAKSRLVRKRAPWIEQTAEDRMARRVKLNVEIANEGETDARNVLVSFFHGEEKTDENLLGVVEIERVPAERSAIAQLVWEYGDEDLDAQGKFKEGFSTEIRLKGSAQRTAE